jgi:hypothetical protein
MFTGILVSKSSSTGTPHRATRHLTYRYCGNFLLTTGTGTVQRPKKLR